MWYKILQVTPPLRLLTQWCYCWWSWVWSGQLLYLTARECLLFRENSIISTTSCPRGRCLQVSQWTWYERTRWRTCFTICKTLVYLHMTVLTYSLSYVVECNGDNRKIATTRQNFIRVRCMPSSLLRLTYLTRPRQSIRVSFSRLQKLQMHGLVNNYDETVVLRVWCNPFAMAIDLFRLYILFSQYKSRDNT